MSMKKTCNERSVEVVRQLVEEADVLGVAVHRLGNGTLWIDCGIEVEGSLEAGRLYALACLGGMADLRFDTFDLDGIAWPSLSVSVSRPLLACVGCQYAGWDIEVKGASGTYRAMGSGPGRMRGSREPLLDRFGLRERTDDAVLALETRTPPDEETATAIAFSCAVSPGKLVLLTAPTASLVGSVQIASRVVETGIHKMIEVDFPVETLFAATGTCPIPPLCADDTEAMGRTNDAVLYGGSAWYALRSGEDLSVPAERLASSSSPDFGLPFRKIVERYEGNFYKMDPLLFSPAEVAVNDLATGRTYCAGQIRADLLRKEWLGS